MEPSLDQVQLCLSAIAYAGCTGHAARQAGPLHRTLTDWLGRVGPTQTHEIAWGPASFRVWWQPSAPALVAFVARDLRSGECRVVLRGGAPVAIWDYGVDSLLCLEQEPWVWSRDDDAAPAVCSGLLRLLGIVRELTPEEGLPGVGRTLAEFLCDALSGRANGVTTAIRVTGHGIGGALAALVALWLHDTRRGVATRDVAWDPELRAQVHCTAFAAPTIGNGDFASYALDNLGPRLQLICNSLDPAPALWDTQALGDLPGLFEPLVREPATIRALLAGLSDTIDRHGVEYEQPPTRLLPGRLNDELPPSFSAQAAYQHLHGYVELLGLAEVLDLDALFDRPSGTDDGPVAQ